MGACQARQLITILEDVWIILIPCTYILLTFGRTLLYFASRSQRDDNQFNLLPQEAASTVTEPIHELANSETTLALAWVPNSPSCLAAGTGAKWLRIYDLRGKSLFYVF